MPIRDFQLERYFARWEFNAPYLISASDCETMSVGELLELAGRPVEELAGLRLGYTESQGDPGQGFVRYADCLAVHLPGIFQRTHRVMVGGSHRAGLAAAALLPAGGVVGGSTLKMPKSAPMSQELSGLK
mgnify:CR=1 FL=1